MSNMSLEVWKIIEMKHKFWAKLLSLYGMEGVLYSTLDIWDLIGFFSDLVISDSLFSSLIPLFDFLFAPIELGPWNIDYSIELPDFEEILRGVLLIIEELKLDNIIIEINKDWLKDIYDAIASLYDILEKEIADNMSKTGKRKGYYCKSKYCYAYYDPKSFVDFVTKTLIIFFKKPGSIQKMALMVNSFGDILEIAEHIREDLFNRLSLMDSIRRQHAFWEFGWWEVSTWGSEKDPYIEFTTYNGRLFKVEIKDLYDAISGCFWDLSFWGSCFWDSDNPQYRHPFKRDNNMVVLVRNKIHRDFMNRFPSTYMIVANYMREGERQKFTPSDRVENYGLGVGISGYLRSVVKKVLNSVPPVQRNLYVSAILDIFSTMFGGRKKGLEAFRDMNLDEYKQYWLRYWTGMGLDPAVLESLYNLLIEHIKTLGSIRIKNRLYFLRKKLGRRLGYGI